MQLFQRAIPSDCNIFQFGDDHDGTKAKHHAGIEQLIDMMLSPYDGLSAQNNYGIHHGDIVEAIMCDDKRSDPANVETDSIFQQIENAGNDYRPVAKKLICILDGNHPRKLWRLCPSDSITNIICRSLGVPFGDWSSRITYTDYTGKPVFKQYCTHGGASVGSKLPDPMQAEAAKKRSLKNALRELASDCVVMSMGHSHQLVDVEPTPRLYIYDKHGEIQQGYTGIDPLADFQHPDNRFYINTGSFYRTQVVGHSTYGERAMYAPVPLGFYILKVRDYKPVGMDRILV